MVTYDITKQRCNKCDNDRATFTFIHGSNPDEICDDCKNKD